MDESSKKQVKALERKKIRVWNTLGKIYLGMAIYSGYMTLVYLKSTITAVAFDGIFWLAFSLAIHQWKDRLKIKYQEKYNEEAE